MKKCICFFSAGLMLAGGLWLGETAQAQSVQALDDARAVKRTLEERDAKRQAMLEEKDERQEEAREKHRQRLRARGAEAIEKRIQRLNQLISRTQSNERLSEARKEDVLMQAREAIDELEKLQERFKQEEDPETLKELLRSVFHDYRIFAVAIPQMRSFVIVGRGEWVTDRLENETIPRIEAAVEKAKTEDKDVSEAQSHLDIAKTQLGEMKDNLEKAEESFSKMKPAQDFTPARNLLEEGKGFLRKARQNLRVIREELHKIRTALFTL